MQPETVMGESPRHLLRRSPRSQFVLSRVFLLALLVARLHKQIHSMQ